jgi:hypothetical protein
VLQKAFPIVGGIALLGTLGELVKKASEAYDAFINVSKAAEKIREEYSKLDYSIRSQTDGMLVEIDKLNNETAKLLGKHQNLLQLEIDQARQSVDKLGQSLNSALGELQKLLSDNKLPWWAALIGKADADTVGIRIKGLQNSLNDIGDIGQAGIASAPNDTELERRKSVISNETMRAYGETIHDLNEDLKKAKALQAEREKVGVLGSLLSPRPADQSLPIASLETAIKATQRQADQVQASYNLEQATKTHDAVKVQVDESKKLLEERQRIQRDAANALTSAIEKEYSGYYKIVATYNEKIKSAQNFDRPYSKQFERPQMRTGHTADGSLTVTPINTGALTSQASTDFFKAQQIELKTQQRNDAEKYMNDLAANQIKADGMRDKALEEQRNFQNESLQAANDATVAQFDLEQQKLDEAHNARVKELESFNALSVKQKLLVEQQKLAIEQDYINKSRELQLGKLDVLTSQTQGQIVGQAEAIAGRATTQEQKDQVNADLSNRLSTLQDSRDSQAGIINSRLENQQAAAAEKAAKAQTQVLQEQYKTTYDYILKESNTFLEAIEDRSEGAWKRIANSFKKTFLDAFNNVISSTVAKKLADFVTGQSGSGAMGKQGGLIMGGSPTQAAGGIAGALSGIFGGGTGVGGTPPFVGNYAVAGGPMNVMGSAPIGVMGGSPLGAMGLPAGIMSGVPMMSGGPAGLANLGLNASEMAQVTAPLGHAPGGGGILGTLGGMFGGHGNSTLGIAAGGIALLSSLGQKGAGGMLSSLGGGGTLGYNFAKLAQTNPYLQKLLPNAGGVGGAVAGAAAGVGLGLFTQGLAHTGVKGFGETLGGGALTGSGIGFMAGGPMGALIGGAIGAGVGALSGLISLFRENPRDKVKRIVKQAYGLNLDDGMADSIAQIAKEQFGNNIPVAVNSAQVRQMLALWAQATGHGAQANAISPQMTAYNVQGSGGMLTNIAGTTNGFASTSYGGTVPTAVPGSGGVTLKLDGPAVTSLLTGVATTVAPAAVQQSYTSNSNRLGTYATLARPGLVTR